jgi:hypothetical protein
MDLSTLTFDELCSVISQLESMPNPGQEHQEVAVHAYANRAERYDKAEKYEEATGDLLSALKILKMMFNIDAEYQMSYYDFLDDAISYGFVYLEDYKLLHKICEEYLYPMQDVLKSRAARETEREIIKKIKENIGDIATKAMSQTYQNIFEHINNLNPKTRHTIES